jgi:HTH-type transcriptional regulator / antitoxin HipB
MVSASMTPVRIPLQELREAKGWSQAELARQSGVAQATISRIEAGTRRVDLDVLERLADSLGVNAVVLVRHTRK